MKRKKMSTKSVILIEFVKEKIYTKKIILFSFEKL